MSWGMTAVAGATLVSGYMGSQAAGAAGDAARDAANTSAGVQRDIFGQIVNNLSPWTQGGSDAMKRLMFLSGGSPVSSFVDTNALRARFTSGGSPGTAMQGTWTPQYGPEGGEVGGYFTYADGTTGSSPTKGGAGTPGTFDQKGYDAAFGRQEDRLRNQGYGSLTQTIDDKFSAAPFSFSRDDFEKSDAYKFMQGEGEKGIMRNAAAMGELRGTRTLKNLARFNQGLASTEYDKAYGRELSAYSTNYGSKLQEFMTNLGIKTGNMERPFGMLQALSGMGLNAGAQTGAAGTAYGANAGNAILQGGVAAGQAAMGSAASWSQALQGGMGNYLTMSRWNDWKNMMPGGLPAAGSPSYMPMYGQGG